MAAATKTEKTEQLSGNNLVIIVLLITLLVVGVSVLVGKSLVTTIARDSKVDKKKVAAEKQLKADVEAAPNLVDAYKQLGDKTPVLADALPNTPDFPSLIVTLENMSHIAGMKLKTVTPAAVASDETTGTTANDISVAPKPQPYKFTISVSGGYPGMNRLMSLIETSARPMRVLDIQLTGSGSALTGNIDLETFYQDKAQLPFSKETVK